MMSSSSSPQIRLDCAEVVSWLLFSEDDSHTAKLLSLGLMNILIDGLKSEENEKMIKGYLNALTNIVADEDHHKRAVIENKELMDLLLSLIEFSHSEVTDAYNCRRYNPKLVTVCAVC